MAAAACQLQQQTVLWEGALELPRYGEGTAEARFAQPVLVTGVRATAGSLDGGLQLPQLVKGHARDLHTPTAARFDLLFNAVAVPQREMQEWRVDQVFPTQHVWLRGRCRSITVQLLGFALDDAPQQIKAAAGARFGPLPEASPLLLLTSAQQGSRKQAAGSPAAARSLPRPPGRQLPLGKIPPAFVLTLAPVAQYWGRWVSQLPLPPGRPKPHAADLIACQEMAEAVLAAQRGSPAALKAKLANTKNVQRLAVDWDGIRDSVLDMATYSCSALGDNLVEPSDVALASAGVSAAIMLAACQDGAAQFLAWPSGGIGVAGAIAVRDLVSTPNQPGLWQTWSMGLLDLLLESCPAVAGPTLQGTLNPAGIPEPQPAQDAAAAADADAAGSAAAEPLLPQGDDGAGPAGSRTHQDASAAAAAGADSAPEPAGSAGGEAAAEGADGFPAAKRQRFEQHADAPATELAAADAAADAQPSAQQAQLPAAGAQPAVQTPPGAEPEQEHGTDELGSEQGDDALLAGLEHSDTPTNEQTAPGAAARRKRQRHQQDADVDADADGLDELDSSEQDGGSGCWGAADGGSEERVDAAGGQQQGGEGQEVALEEGDYPEADEEAIRAEAAAKAARRHVQRRPPVCELACGQLYAAILQLSMSPLCHSAAVSCKSVLRRLRAYQCLDALQVRVNPVLSGKVDPLQLSTQDLCSIVNSAAAAANDLAALVLQPQPSSRSLFLYAQPEGQADSSVLLLPQRQEADFCVLQLLLSFRVMDLLSAVSSCIGAHLTRHAHTHLRHQEGANQHTEQQQHDGLQPQSPSQQQPQQTPEPPNKPAAMLVAEQQSLLCLQHAQLLDSIRALTSALTASSGGWSFLTAARDGLAALAAAVCPTSQVCLDGGPFSPDTAAPYDTQHGWEAAREALTAAASGLAGEPVGGLQGAGDSASAAGDMSDSLQRLWLLVEATAVLQGAEDVLSGKDRTPGAVDKLNAAMKTLFVGGFASELGQQSLVSALSACSPAVNQLSVLLKHCSQVHAAAAEAEEDQAPGSQQSQDRALNLSLGLRVVYGALYAPEVLLALVSSPHPDAIATWLPLTEVLHDAIRQQLYQQDASAPAAAAARAAFPNALALDPAALQECGLPTAVLPGGAAAAQGSSQAVLMQLHGAVLTAHNLVQLWQGRDAWAPLGSGSAGKLLEWLHAQLPKLEAAASKTAEPSEPEGVAPKLPKTASAAYVAAQASDSDTQLDGAAAAGGAAPPAGRDVRSDAVVEFMHSAGCRSAALCSLHLLDMLLRGAPHSVRSMAQREHRKASSGNKQTVAAFMPAWDPGLRRSSSAGVAVSVDGAAVAVSVSGAAGEGGDGFAAREVVQELLDGVSVKPHADKEAVQVEVFELLERALRTATVALRASDADLVWLVKGGGQQDILLVLQARTDAAALMRAACTTTASLLVHLSDAGPRREGQSSAIHHDGLLDALICAHSAVVTCQEGLQACVPQPRLSPFIIRATEPGLDPVQRAAADAAVGAASLRVCGGRVLLLLEARQALAVCLRCWQLQGWWPDPVGALLGSFPRASTAAEGFAKEDAEAHREGDPLAPPPPAPRQGPRQLLSSLLGLADLCPEEWPHRGASQVAARQRDAAAAAEGRDSTSAGPAAFERPSLILLRQSVADAIEVHWDSLERLVDFGLSCSTRFARLALVRMLVRMAGLGAGLAPLLGPKVLLALCSRLYGIQQLRKGLASRLLQIMQGPVPAAECSKQQLIDREINALHLQLRGTAQVCEVLLPLCGAPSIKSVLTEHKGAGVLGKAVFALVKPAADLAQLAADKEAAAGTTGRAANGAGAAGSSAPAVGPGLARLGSEVQVLAGLLLQLVAVLMDPDISMNPGADRSTRELVDTPSISTSSITIAWVLAAAPHLSPSNMAAAAQLLTGRSTAAPAEALAKAAAATAATAAESAGTPLGEAAGSVGAQQDAGAGASQPGGAPDRVQQQPAGRGAVGLSGSAKGRAALLHVGRQWQLLEQSLRETQKREVLPSAAAAMPLPPPLQVSGSGMTQAELQASAEWAAGALEATQCAAGGPDPSHAASCAAVAQVLRELGGSSSACTSAWQEYEAVVEAEVQQQLKPQHTWKKFIVAAKSAAAAHRPGGPNQQSPATLLSSPPLLLACDAACLDFWAASAAAVQHAEACPLAPAQHPHTAARPTASASSWWPQPLLVGGSNPGPRSQAIEDAMEAARKEEKKQRDKADEGGPGGGGGDDDDDQAGGGGGGPGGGFVPAVYAQRGPQFLRGDNSSRKASKHVDTFQRQQCYTCGMDGHLASTCPHGGAGALTCFNCGQDGHLARDCPQGPLKCYNCGEEGHLARDCQVPDKCHRCGQVGHLVKDCKAPAAQRGVGLLPPPPPPPPPRPREGPGPGLPPWHGRSSSVQQGVPPGARQQLAAMQQQAVPQVSPRAGSVAAAPADPRLKARRSSQQGGAGGGSVSPLSPSGGSGGSGAHSGLLWPHSGVLPPDVRLPGRAGGGGGVVLTPPAAAAALVLPATPGPGEEDADGDADAALLRGLLVDDSQDAAAAAGGMTGQEQVDGETGIDQYLDELLGGVGGEGEEDQEPRSDEGGYGVTEAGGL